MLPITRLAKLALRQARTGLIYSKIEMSSTSVAHILWTSSQREVFVVVERITIFLKGFSDFVEGWLGESHKWQVRPGAVAR